MERDRHVSEKNFIYRNEVSNWKGFSGKWNTNNENENHLCFSHKLDRVACEEKLYHKSTFFKAYPNESLSSCSLFRSCMMMVMKKH